MWIELSGEQVARAERVGSRRQEYNEGIAKPDAYGFTGDGRRAHVQGATAELAVSLALGESWVEFSEEYEGLAADVGADLQVRSTLHERGNLLLHPRDKDEQPFVLVRLHKAPEVEICGWVLGRHGKHEQYWRDDGPFESRPCFLYPSRHLKGMGSLAEQRGYKGT